MWTAFRFRLNSLSRLTSHTWGFIFALVLWGLASDVAFPKIPVDFFLLLFRLSLALCLSVCLPLLDTLLPTYTPSFVLPCLLLCVSSSPYTSLWSLCKCPFISQVGS